MKRTLPVLLGLTLIALTLAACAAPTSAPAAAATQPAAPTATQPAATAPAATDPAGAAYPAAGETPAAQATTDPAYPAADGEIQFTLVPDQSEARYLVKEQLAGKDLPNDAIGKTSQMSGAVFISADGKIDTTRSKFVVQADTLATDQSRRDGFVKQNVLQTSQYPEIVFVPSSISGLSDPISASGEVTFTLTGNLTIRDVTKEVTWEVTGKIDGNTATGTAKTSFTFADFNLTQPRVPVVLSVDENIRLEMDVTLQRAGN
jgi:polyisoprenoid-binding protein YceI